MAVAGSSKPVHQAVVHAEREVVVDLLNAPLAEPAMERRPLLVHQTIGRDMLHAETEGLVDVLFPVGEGLARKSEHQVDGDIADARLAQQRRGPSHLSSRMATA